MRSIRPAVILLVSAAVIFAGGLLTGRLRAQQSGASPTPFYVITFVDLIPPNKDAGVALLKQYVDTTRKEPGSPVKATRSDGFTFLTPSPTDSTTPAPSAPGVKGTWRG